MPLFKNEEDRIFARDLFRKAVLHKDEFRKLVESFTEKLDCGTHSLYGFSHSLETAITEAVEFIIPSRPVWLPLMNIWSIAKSYST